MKEEIKKILEDQDELTLIDLMSAFLSKEEIIELMLKWDDEKLEEAMDNLGFASNS